MKRIYKICEIIVKVSFSAVLLQLFFIALGAEAGRYAPSYLFGMLEYTAASCTVTLGGALLMDYILKTEGK